MEKKLSIIANHLLDLGKRNRLLNYKDTGLRSLAILNQNIEEIFIDITAGKTYSIFMLDPILQKYHSTMTLGNEDVTSYSYLKVYDIANQLIKNNQFLCYKKGYSLIKVLKSLIREYKFSITEKGINTLYLSLGFINYFEDEVKYKAPLLLIPVEIKEEKGIYKIKEYEDEVILNPTLKYYFKTTLSTVLPEYNDLNILQYFESVEKVLPEDCSLEVTAALGLYSFLKMNMYEDLTTNKENIVTNINIQALLGGNPTFPQPQDKPIFPVVNCDSSQLEAIKFATSGRSFVLQGPPGSGKSQTITNIIASLIASGKHVLFVSEKLAALNVVYENLRRAGLSEFAIELHSNKANKKEFIENLYKTAILPKYNINTKADIVKENHYVSKETILEYYNELHKEREEYGCSLYDIYSMYSNINIPSINYRLKNIEGFNISDLDKLVLLFDNYVTYSKNIGYDYKNTPLYGLSNISLDYLRYEMDNVLIKASNHLNKLLEIKESIDKKLKNSIISINDLYNSLDLIEVLVNLKAFNLGYLKLENRNILKTQIEEYKKYKESLNKNALDNYRESILNEDLEKLFIEYKVQSSKAFKIFNKKFKEINARILAYRHSKAKYKVVLEELEQLIIYKGKTAKMNKCLAEINKYINNDEKEFDVVLNDISMLSKFNDIELLDSYDIIKKDFIDILVSFRAYQVDSVYLNDISTKFNTKIFDLFNVSINEVISKLKGIYLKKDTINEYLMLMKCVEEINKVRLNDYLDDYLKNGNDINKISLQFRKQFLASKMYEIIDKSMVLSAFSSTNLDSIIEKFKGLDEQLLLINRDYIISNMSQKRPDDVLIAGSKFKVLVREYNKVRKQKPIRLLLSEIFELALDIKPVFLMSPLSVSTYLSSNVGIFDCVIFDEASQIFAWDALGAIYRAKQCIIIGDTKQMPPSNFFGTTVEDVEDEADELDSILDIASTCFLSSKLKWHYRSRSEELITFSNGAFYDNELITIPQAKKHMVGFGIDFYHLPTGVYDMKTRTNFIEAAYICDMVLDHFKNSNQSLGVVAFSNVQASLIESMIEQRLIKEPEIIEKMNSGDEPFFVKNLETVQGDERDRIIFSICYGYNAENKFHQRFGPLNNLGGERRLNVAITRAKYNISIVSSIVSSDIRVDNTESLGVKLLKDYLEFAQNVTTSKKFEESDDGVINSVKDYLIEKGYDVYPNYGTSQFKIDLAIMKDNEFILAVMLDNKPRYQNNTTDRYRLEQLLLERLGWKYHRVYSTAWINNYEVEKNRLLEALIVDDIIEVSEEAESYLAIDESDNSLESKFDKYEELSVEFLKKLLSKYGLKQTIIELVKYEGPIHEEYLLRRVAAMLDKSRVTNVVKNLVNQNMSSDIIRSNRFYYVDLSKSYKLRLGAKRDIDEIHLNELKNGILTIVTNSNGITKEGCFKTLVSLLGYNRVTENTVKVLEDVLIHLKLDGAITQRGECLYI